MNEIASVYSKSQSGGELPYFIGKQYGSGWLRTIGRFAFPILKKLGIIAANTAQDVIMKDQKILPTLKGHAQTAFNEVTSNLFAKPSSNNKRKNISNSNINKRKKRKTIFSK